MGKTEPEWTPAMRAIAGAINDMTEMGDINLYDIPETIVTHWIANAVRPVILREAADIIEEGLPGCCGGAHDEGSYLAIDELRNRADVAEGVNDGQA